MADTPATPSKSQRYSEQEMALILKRAAELQEGADGRGVQRTLGEIEEIAAEVGIEPPFIAEAVAELQRPRARVGWLGAPTRFHDERSVDGTLSTSELGELLDRARAELGLHGEVRQVLDGVELHARSALGVSILTLAPRGPRTRIALTMERLDQAVVIAAGSVGIGVLSGLGGFALATVAAPNGFVASVMIAGAAIGGTLVSARVMWRDVADRWRAKTHAIVTTLAERAETLSGREPKADPSLRSG